MYHFYQTTTDDKHIKGAHAAALTRWQTPFPGFASGQDPSTSDNALLALLCGGVPALLVPDDLKSAIDLGNRYEPSINATCADMAAPKPLRRDAYDYAEWLKAKPGIDYHIAVDKRFYSVPHNLIGLTLDVCGVDADRRD